MKWVGQEEPNGCVAATLAMILGYTYAEAVAILGNPASDGCYSKVKQFRILWQCGYKTAPIDQAPEADFYIASVKLHESSAVLHSVILLPDGSVLDPMTPNPQTLSSYFHVGIIYGVIPPEWKTQPAKQ